MKEEAPRLGDQTSELSPDQKYLAEGCELLGLRLTAAQLAKLLCFRDLLLEWNARINLTAITDPQEILSKHLLDSLSCLLAIPNWQNRAQVKLLDVGSGGGFPGIPLALACPTWQVTLLEATGKKVRFLEEAIAQLGLGGRVGALQGRAEEVAHDSHYRARFDVVTARGLASLPVLLEYCLPFCRVAGLVIAQKKGEISAELERGHRAAALLGGRLRGVQAMALPGLEDQRVLVVYEALRKAPAQYPRRAGAPAKHPLA